MFLLLLPLLTQDPLERRILETEHQRSEEVSALTAGLQSTDPRIQRLAVRAVGRLERPGLSTMVEPMLKAQSAEVRREAVNAMAQLKAPFDFAAMLVIERDVSVRQVIFATIGRLPNVPGQSEKALVAGLGETDLIARTGAARGMESLLRLNRTVRPDSVTLAALRAAVVENRDATMRKYLTQTLTASGERDSATFALLLNDPDPQVRRLAVMGWRPLGNDPPFSGRPEAMEAALSDSSALVRLEALKSVPGCEVSRRFLKDPSDHVAMLAIDQLGTRRCDASLILEQLERGATWRARGHALVALARAAPEAVRARIGLYADDPNPVMRLWVVEAAKLIRDEPTLTRLAKDKDPNVAIAAMTTPADAIRALSSSHNGLLFTAAQRLRNRPELAAAIPQVLEAVLRMSATGRSTVRDSKIQLLERIREAGPITIAPSLRPLLSDVDPQVATLAATIMTQKSGTKVEPITTRYAFAPLPPDTYLRGLVGATATFTMRGLGSFTVALLMDDAPASAAAFAQTAENGVFNGLTFHRIEPNFLIQGGSPGADEYDGATTYFMPEEVGLLWHDRGTMGTSTRGHDTGDGQLYINTVDNYRLDNTYTLYARVINGMSVVDRIQIGDVIESVKIQRKSTP